MEHVKKDDRDVVMKFITDFSRLIGERWYHFNEAANREHYHQKVIWLPQGHVVFSSLNAFLNNYRFTLEQGFDGIQYRVRLPDHLKEETGNAFITALNSFPFFYYTLVEWLENKFSVNIDDVDYCRTDVNQIMQTFMKDYEGNYQSCLEFSEHCINVEVSVELMHSNGGRVEYFTEILKVTIDPNVLMKYINRLKSGVYDMRIKHYRSTNDNMEGLLHISQTDKKE